MKVTVRSLAGNVELTLEGDDVTAANVREAAGIASTQTLRCNGARVENDDAVEDGATYIATPPDAKHGFRS